MLCNCSKDNNLSIGNIFDTYIDPRDGKQYKTVNINNKTWMVDNFAYQINNNSLCRIYENDSNNIEIYGRLYTFDAAINYKPEGWRLPSRYELIDLFTTLNYFNYNDEIFICTTEELSILNYKAGGMSYSHGFMYINYMGIYWTSSGNPKSNYVLQYYPETTYVKYSLRFSSNDRRTFCSVRYVKD